MSQTPLADAGGAERRAAVLQTLDILDTPAEDAFDRLTRLVSTLLDVPVSLVSLVDTDRQFFKSQYGLPEPWASRRETPLSYSFCKHVVADEAPLIVGDARTVPRLQDNLSIEELGVIAYAGVPLVAMDGTVIGSLCAVDTKPRSWTDADIAILRELANVARGELTLRIALRTADDARRAAQLASAERIAVIESSTDGIYTLDLDGRCTMVNSAAVAALGFTREQMLGQNMHDLMHHHRPDGTPFPEADCPFYHAFRAGVPERLDGTVLWRADGSSFTADCTSSPLIFEGQVQGAVVTLRDVSDRIAAAALLRESEMKFRAIFENAGIGIAITSGEGLLLDCNDAYEQITGHSRSELLSTRFDMVSHPDDIEEQFRLGRELMSGVRDQFQMDKRYIRTDRSVVWGRLTATAVRSESGAPFIVGVVEDVTAQLRAEGAVRLLAEAGAVLASSLEYETILRDVGRLALPLLGEACVIDVQREDGTLETFCVHLDPERESMLSAALAAALVVPEVGVAAFEGLADAMPPRDRDSSRGGIGESPSARRDVMAALGLRASVQVPLRGRERTLGLLTFASDYRTYVRDDFRLAEELGARASAAIENALLYRRAQNATHARDEVLAVVSHDLRNPVHTITMAASFLLETPELDVAARQAQTGVISRAADRATRLINDLLDVTRIENGQLRLDRRRLPAADLLQEALQQAAQRAHSGGLVLSGAMPDGALQVDGDRFRIVQALDNLIGNAMKFTPVGGTVEVSARPVTEGVEFMVRDSGSGIPTEDQPNLFRRFWQARRSDRRGVGLGLSIVKGIVDAHGGDIHVESDGRSGSTIRFSIPSGAAGRDEGVLMSDAGSTEVAAFRD